MDLLGKEEKLKIIAYKDPERQGAGEEIEFSINPSQVSSRHENQFSRLRGINTSGRSAPYVKSLSDVLSLQLILDNSTSRDNLVEAPQIPSPPPVGEQVQHFLDWCQYMDGDIHEPRFLRVQWGTIDFECRLQSVEIKYTRFDKAGNPLRAELDAVFISDMPEKKRIRLENKKSPDITHSRIIKQEDTISGLSKKVYGNAGHYLTIAQANQLDHFRRLKPGEEIFFPPLEK